METRFLPYMTWPEVDAIDKRNALVVLPLGATEQHGPHLPLYTDTLISSGVLKRAMGRLSEDELAYMLSPITISKSNEHRGFAGTLWIGTKTLYDVLFDVGRSVHESGFRKLCFFNGHGGNLGILQAVTRDLREGCSHLLVLRGRIWTRRLCPKESIPGSLSLGFMQIFLRPQWLKQCILIWFMKS